MQALPTTRRHPPVLGHNLDDEMSYADHCRAQAAGQRLIQQIRGEQQAERQAVIDALLAIGEHGPVLIWPERGIYRHAGPRRVKFVCVSCDYVCKARHGACCPHCGEPMTSMGTIWKPGPRGNRDKNYPAGWGNIPPFGPYFREGKRRVNGRILPGRNM